MVTGSTEILIHEPGWLSYQEQARLVNAIPKFVPYNEDINHIDKSIFYIEKHIQEIKQNISILRKKIKFLKKSKSTINYLVIKILKGNH